MFDVIKTVYKTRKECKEVYNIMENIAYGPTVKGCACAFVSGVIEGTKISLAATGALAIAACIILKD